MLAAARAVCRRSRLLTSCFWLQFVVGLGDKVAPTDIEEGMRVG